MFIIQLESKPEPRPLFQITLTDVDVTEILRTYSAEKGIPLSQTFRDILARIKM